MILSIETHLDITPDILSNISTQLEQWLHSWHSPYKWSIKKTPFIEDQILDCIDEDVENAIEAIRNTERSFGRLRELISNPYYYD